MPRLTAQLLQNLAHIVAGPAFQCPPPTQTQTAHREAPAAGAGRPAVPCSSTSAAVEVARDPWNFSQPEGFVVGSQVTLGALETPLTPAVLAGGSATPRRASWEWSKAAAALRSLSRCSSAFDPDGIFAKAVGSGRGYQGSLDLSISPGSNLGDFVQAFNQTAGEVAVLLATGASSAPVRYQLDRRLGQGGQGETFLATLAADEIPSNHTPAEIVLKVVPVRVGYGYSAAARAQEQQLEQEIAALGRLVQRPGAGIVQFLGYTQAVVDGQQSHVIAMEYVPGESVSAFAAAQAGGGGAAAWDSWLLQKMLPAVLKALQACHAAGVVHGDISPENILYDARRERFTLVDFGLAGVDNAQQCTAREKGFLVPELSGRCDDEGIAMALALTPKVDVYSLGLTLLYLATGKPPFATSRGGDTVQWSAQELERELRGVRHGGLRELVRAMLTKDPAQRPEVAELERRLSALNR